MLSTCMWLEFEYAYCSIYQTCTCCKQQKIKSYAENIGEKCIYVCKIGILM
jgi:hypothetical protein